MEITALTYIINTNTQIYLPYQEMAFYKFGDMSIQTRCNENCLKMHRNNFEFNLNNIFGKHLTLKIETDNNVIKIYTTNTE